MNSTNRFYDEVLAMLEAGNDMTDIAKHITEEMNKAQADYNDKVKAVKAKARKAELVGAIYDAVHAYMDEFCPELIDADEDREANLKLVTEALDVFISTAHNANDDKSNIKTNTVKSRIVPITPAEADKIISDWLEKLHF